MFTVAIVTKPRTVAKPRTFYTQEVACFGLMCLPALANTTNAKMIIVATGASMSTQQKSLNLAGADNAAGKPLEIEMSEPPIMALFNVVVAALAGMGLVLMVGAWYDAVKPTVKDEAVFYECTFDMGTSLLTRKCEVLGKWSE